MEAYKKKGYFPASRIVTFCQTHKLSVDWILTGNEGDSNQRNEIQKIKDELLEVYRENSELKSRVHDLEEKLAQLRSKKQ